MHTTTNIHCDHLFAHTVKGILRDARLTYRTLTITPNQAYSVLVVSGETSEVRRFCASIKR